MKQEFKPISWIVKIFDFNTQSIRNYDVIGRREAYIKKMKKECSTKEEFIEALKREMHWRFWSRSEYELIIQITDGDRVILLPWSGCSDSENAAIDVTNDDAFDWKSFANYHIAKQACEHKAKIDIYDQIMWTWPKMAEYCWYTRLKYQRDDPKFHK